MNKHFKLTFVLAAIFFLGGGAAGWLAARGRAPAVIGFYKIHPATADYKFTKPLLAVEWTEEIQFSEYAELKEKLSRYIAASKVENKADQIGVYYRDLENGHWMGVNEKEKFHPASLYKLPIMLAYLKNKTRTERETQKLVYPGAPAIEEHPEYDLKNSELQTGQSYTLKELIEKMIVSSDNGAKNLLLSALDPNYLKDTFSDLGINVPQSEQDEITPQNYSLFLRILYNASFVNARSSEWALDLLSRSTFRDGLVAGLPPDTQIAHKYGIYAEYQGKEIKAVELHDCGIIYKGANPSLLCVMTRGSHSTQGLKDAIRDITGIVYNN